MSDVQPQGESLRKAIRFVSQRLEEDPERPLMALVDEATLRFDLSPKDAEFLIRFQREARERRGG